MLHWAAEFTGPRGRARTATGVSAAVIIGIGIGGLAVPIACSPQRACELDEIELGDLCLQWRDRPLRAVPVGSALTVPVGHVGMPDSGFAQLDVRGRHVEWWASKPDGALALEAIMAVPPSRAVASGDLDGDGRDDLVLVPREEPGLWLAESVIGGRAGAWHELSTPGPVEGVEIVATPGWSLIFAVPRGRAKLWWWARPHGRLDDDVGLEVESLPFDDEIVGIDARVLADGQVELLVSHHALDGAELGAAQISRGIWLGGAPLAWSSWPSEGPLADEVAFSSAPLPAMEDRVWSRTALGRALVVRDPDGDERRWASPEALTDFAVRGDRVDVLRAASRSFSRLSVDDLEAPVTRFPTQGYPEQLLYRTRNQGESETWLRSQRADIGIALTQLRAIPAAASHALSTWRKLDLDAPISELAHADIDDDAIKDLVVATDAGVQLLWGRGRGEFAQGPSLALDRLGRDVALWLHDFDDDGRAELLLYAGVSLARDEGLWMLELSDAGIELHAEENPAQLWGRPELADLDGDGRPELSSMRWQPSESEDLVEIMVRPGRPWAQGSFGPSEIHSLATEQPRGWVFAELDGAAGKELLMALRPRQLPFPGANGREASLRLTTLEWRPGTGDSPGTWTEIWSDRARVLDLTWLVVADADDDGRVDVSYCGQRDDDPRAMATDLRGGRTGRISAPVDGRGGIDFAAAQMHMRDDCRVPRWVDMDGDGRLEEISRVTDVAGFHDPDAAEHDVVLDIHAPIDLAQQGGSTRLRSRWRMPHAGQARLRDLDGDGRRDAIDLQHARWARNVPGGSGVLESGEPVAYDGDIRSWVRDDFDDDGVKDIVLASSNSPHLWWRRGLVAENGHPGNFEGGPVSRIDRPARAVASGRLRAQGRQVAVLLAVVEPDERHLEISPARVLIHELVGGEPTRVAALDLPAAFDYQQLLAVTDENSGRAQLLAHDPESGATQLIVDSSSGWLQSPLAGRAPGFASSFRCLDGRSAVLFGGRSGGGPRGRETELRVAVMQAGGDWSRVGILDTRDPIWALAPIEVGYGEPTWALLAQSVGHDASIVQTMTVDRDCRPQIIDLLVTSLAYAQRLATGDLDGDGIDEIALNGDQGTSLHRRADDGEFRIESFMTAAHGALEFSDLNGDGRAELVVSWSGMLARLGLARLETEDASAFIH